MNQQTADAKPSKRGGNPTSLANLTGGSRKGKPNKVTTLAKNAIAEAADRVGGTDRLVAWIQEDKKNETTFWGTIYPKLLPLQVTGEDGGAVQVAFVTRQIVDPKGL